MEFVTNRTQAHVDMLEKLRKKCWDDMTASEQAAWYGNAAKGAYNHTDLNRVERAVAKIAARMNRAPTTKTNWTVWDIPTQADMERYLGNVVTIKENYLLEEDPAAVLPELPDSMANLTYQGANAIEKVLEIVSQGLGLDDDGDVLGTGVLGQMILGER